MQYFSLSGLFHLVGFPVAQLVNKTLAIQKNLIRFLGREDPLEKG